MGLKNKFKKKMLELVVRATGAMVQSEGMRSKDKIITDGMPEILRAVAAQGAVLLENRVLPFAEGTEVAVFGRTQKDYFYCGYGSGGDVNRPYQVSLLDGMRACSALSVNEEVAKKYDDWCEQNPVEDGGWGSWPRFYPEMLLQDEVVKKAAQSSKQAVVVIGRAAGEDRESVLEKGSFYLADAEEEMLETVTKHFTDTVIVLNIGSIMDLSWIEAMKDKLGAVLLVWQGGMESGNAVADLLSGKVTPSGRLTDTVARKYASYPSVGHFGAKAYSEYVEDIYVGYRWFETFDKEAVQYPFGYGLSYTSFSQDVGKLKTSDEGYSIKVKVTNTGGQFSGKETACLYIEKPCAVLGTPSRELLAFSKTEDLAPGKSEEIELFVGKEQLASYDATGQTGHKSCYVIQKGSYGFYLGTDVRSAQKAGECSFETDVVIQQLSELCAPRQEFDIITAVQAPDGSRQKKSALVPMGTLDLKRKILADLPKDVPITGDKGYKLADVKTGKVSMDDFVAQLSLDELEAISRGAYIMNSPLGTPGNAGVMGGVTSSLQEKGVPAITTTDGPSGIRLFSSCSLLPVGTVIASTFDTKLTSELYAHLGREMKARGSDVLLAPGMNIHRNPLCGRNFEYFSEDPLVSGLMAAAVVEGLQSTGVSACPKHFACNNQEFNRTRNDSRVSERAIREIYLKGFEICIKKAKPQNLMTSYNKINGVWGHYHYELCTGVLRQEWGYEGNVMTDWWMKDSRSPEFKKLRNNAYRVRAQVDVLMPGGKLFKNDKPDGTLLKSYGKPEGITLGEMQRSARNVLNFSLLSKHMK